MVRLFMVTLSLLMCVVSGWAQTVVQSPKECTELAAQVARDEVRLKDWPALARYREENARLTGNLIHALRLRDRPVPLQCTRDPSVVVQEGICSVHAEGVFSHLLSPPLRC